MARRFRIVVSLFFVVLTVGLCVLWLRSYWRTDVLVIPTDQSGTLSIGSLCGTFALLNASSDNESLTWQSSEPKVPPTRWGWAARQNSDGSWIRTIFFPTWILMIVCATIATLPWLPYSRCFSLRTLFIATTLAAVLIGLITWPTLS